MKTIKIMNQFRISLTVVVLLMLTLSFNSCNKHQDYNEHLFYSCTIGYNKWSEYSYFKVEFTEKISTKDFGGIKVDITLKDNRSFSESGSWNIYSRDYISKQKIQLANVIAEKLGNLTDDQKYFVKNNLKHEIKQVTIAYYTDSTFEELVMRKTFYNL